MIQAQLPRARPSQSQLLRYCECNQNYFNFIVVLDPSIDSMQPQYDTSHYPVSYQGSIPSATKLPSLSMTLNPDTRFRSTDCYAGTLLLLKHMLVYNTDTDTTFDSIKTRLPCLTIVQQLIYILNRYATTVRHFLNITGIRKMNQKLEIMDVTQ